MSDYTDRELRLMAERDAALTRAEKAESALKAANEDRDAAWESRDAEVAAKERLVASLNDECDGLKAALREACDIADASICVGPTRSEERRISELRAKAFL